MRHVYFRKPNSDVFELYVDIGSCEKHYDLIPMFDDRKETYADWISFFSKLPEGVQSITIDYFIREVNAGNSIPIELNDKIKNHIETFKDFTVSWFSPDLPQFRHLDLEWEEVEQLVVGIKRNSDERTMDINLNDGSVLRIDRDEESFRSLYLPLGELEHLKSDLAHLLSLLK